jgi:hypothetical protein
MKKLGDDLVESDDLAKFFDDPTPGLHESLGDSWRALDDAGFDDAIRRNPDYVKNVDDYTKRSGNSPNDVADIAKNNENGVDQFIAELEDTPATGYWDENPFERGRLIEDVLGRDLPQNFKTSDKYDNITGEATSIKSLDLDAKTYQTPSKLRSRLKKYMNEIEDFTQHQVGVVSVGDKLNPINSRTLELAIPRAADASQLDVINEIIRDGLKKKINVKIIVFP